MNSLDLIASLRRRAESIHISDEIRPDKGSSPLEYVPGSIEYASECLKRYNYEAYLEIKDPETTVAVVDVDDDAIMEFQSILDAYMDAYAPNRHNLKDRLLNYLSRNSVDACIPVEDALKCQQRFNNHYSKLSAARCSFICPAEHADMSESFCFAGFIVSSNAMESFMVVCGAEQVQQAI